MTIRFLADENFDRAIVKGLQRRAPSIDILTAQEAGLRMLDDPAVLAWAAGVFEIRESLPRGPVIEDLLLISGASEPEDWKDTVHYLPLR